MPSIFDVVTQMIAVVTNSTQTTPTRYALKFSWREPGCHIIIFWYRVALLNLPHTYTMQVHVAHMPSPSPPLLGDSMQYTILVTSSIMDITSVFSVLTFQVLLVYYMLRCNRDLLETSSYIILQDITTATTTL